MNQSEIEQVEAAIAALEAQRETLGDDVVETALAPLREKLAALIEPATTPDERKRITVLFADVTGYTSISETLDPEDVTSIMNQLFEALTEEITRYGGTVDKFSGDAVMALFGAPDALENHEEMAVRAALGMQRAIAGVNSKLTTERDITLRLRIGLHTGEVLAGWVGAGDARSYTVMGDSVNLASRLEHACPVGRIMISTETARPLHAIFDFEPPRQITVKGKSEPITVYVVMDEKKQRGRVRGIAGLTAPMVGRDNELAVLRDTFNRAMSENPWRAAVVIGEAGIGKTRLKREFVSWATQTTHGARLLSARSYTHTRATPYYLVASLMRSLLNIGDDINHITAEMLGQSIRRLDSDLNDTEFRYRLGSLASVLGITLDDDPLGGLAPEQRRDRTFLSLERILLRASEQMPLLIVVDDLHWADALSLAFLKRLLKTVARKPAEQRSAMLLIMSRPPDDTHALFATILAEMHETPHLTLELERLDTTQAGALVSALLDRKLPAGMLDLVIDHAQGNPFFVEEILRSLIEDEIIVQADAGWRLTQPVTDIDVPGTIQDILATRLDRLPFELKQTIQYAAIIGRTFWHQLLVDVMTADHAARTPMPARIETILSRLESRHLIARLTESQIADDWEWVFEHVLIQEVAYSGVLKSVRRRVHREVAEQLERHLSERTNFLIPFIAYHFERGDVPAKAVRYLQQAGDRAADQYANEDAVEYYTRALDGLEDAGLSDDQEVDIRYELLLGRESVFGLMGRRNQQADDLDRLQRLTEHTRNDRHRATVALRAATYHEAISDFSAALAAASEATQHAENVNNTALKTEGLVASANALWRQGELEDAHRQLRQALILAREDGNEENEATSLHYLGTVLYFLGDYDEARSHLERALELRQATQDRKGEATTLSNLIGIYDELGDLMKAQEYGERALRIVRDVGNRWSEAYSLMNLGNIYHNLGRLDKAQRTLEYALDLFEEMNDKSGIAMTSENLSSVLFDLGSYAAAMRYCEQSLALERSIGDERGEAYSLNRLGLAHEALSELDAAQEAFQQAHDIRERIGQNSQAIDDVAGLARIALRQNDTDMALEYAQRALDWISAHGTDGIESPIRVYLTCAKVLRANGEDEDADRLLVSANEILEQRAARIQDKDTLRAFLERLPIHRKLLHQT